MIKLSNVSKNFKGRPLYDDLNLSINSNEVTFILGKSGSGKSTLLNLIGGIDDVDSGYVQLIENDEITNISTKNREYISKNVGFIFQDYNLIGGISAKRNLLIAKHLAGKSTGNTESHSLINLGIVNPNQNVESLSGGEKQRVAILRALEKDAKIILADEPTGNLDSNTSELVMEEITKSKEGRYIVVVSHDKELALKYADRIIEILDGKIIEDYYQKDVNKKFLLYEKPKKEKTFKNILFDILILFLSKLRRNLSRVILLIIVMSLAISSIVFSIRLNSLGNIITNSTQISFLESDLITVKNNRTLNYSGLEKGFSDEEVNKIVSNYKVDEVVTQYYCQSGYGISYGDINYKAPIKVIKTTEFFKKRINDYNIEGKFPINENEIVISSTAITELKLTDPIGKHVYFNDNKGNSLLVEIVGINNKISISEEIYTFVQSQTLIELQKKTLKENIENNQMFNMYTDKLGMSSGGFKGKVKSYTPENILYGKYPDSSTNIMISSKLLEYQTKGKEINQSLLEGLYKATFTFVYNDVYFFNICGIFESEKLEIIVNSETYNSLFEYKPNVIDVYLSDHSKSSKIASEISTKYDVDCKAESSNLKSIVEHDTRFFMYALIFSTVLFIIIAILLILSFVKFNISEKRKDIGILKSLGIKNKNIFLLLSLDFVFIFTISYFLSFGFIAILRNILKGAVNDVIYKGFGFPVVEITCITLIAMIISIIYVILSSTKLISKKTSKLLRDIN